MMTFPDADRGQAIDSWERRALQSVGDGLILADDEGRVSEINRAAATMTGWDPATARGMDIREVFQIVDASRPQEIIDTSQWCGSVRPVVGLSPETLLLSSTSGRIPIDAALAPFVTESGQRSGITVSFRRRTGYEAKELQINLSGNRSLEQLHSAVLKNLPEAVFEIDRSGRIVAVKHLPVYLDKKTVLEQNLFELITEEYKYTLQAALGRVLSNGKSTDCEFELQAAEGRRWWAVDLAPLWEEGQIPHFLLIGRDQTELRAVERSSRLHVSYLESMERVNGVIEGDGDLQSLLLGLMKVVREIFDCDRAFVAYPADLQSPSFKVVAEAAVAEYPGADSAEIPLTESTSAIIRDVLSSRLPLRLDPNSGRLPGETARSYNVKSELLTAMIPRTGRPWLFGLHQCSFARNWRDDEQRLLRDIGRRIADAISNLVLFGNLQNSEERFRKLAELTSDFCYQIEIREDGREIIRWHTDRAKEFTGYSTEDIAQLGLERILYSLQLEENKRLMQRFRSGTTHVTREYCFNRKDGQKRWVAERLRAEMRGTTVVLYGGLRDVTERRETSERLAASLAEKDALLKEIHHRVKNNLQVISSLLNLQSKTIDDRRALAAFRDSQDRVRTMSLIHEKLYTSPNLSRIEFDSYLRTLVPQIVRSIGAAAQPLIHIEAAEAALSVGQAIPSGLIINELLTNAIKYAFPADWQRKRKEADKIVVQFALENNERCRLHIADNGIGLDESVDTGGTTIGLKLVMTLVEQLGGSITIDRNPGAAFTISFPLRTHE